MYLEMTVSPTRGYYYTHACFLLIFLYSQTLISLCLPSPCLCTPCRRFYRPHLSACDAVMCEVMLAPCFHCLAVHRKNVNTARFEIPHDRIQAVSRPGSVVALDGNDDTHYHGCRKKSCSASANTRLQLANVSNYSWSSSRRHSPNGRLVWGPLRRTLRRNGTVPVRCRG